MHTQNGIALAFSLGKSLQESYLIFLLETHKSPYNVKTRKY